MTEEKKAQIETMENSHNNESVIIVGNGPSLSETPVEKLGEQYPTIATNFINKIYTSTSWRPTYYVLTRLLEENNYQDVRHIIAEDTTCFINITHRDTFGSESNIHYVNVVRGNDLMIDCLESPNYPEKQKNRWSDNIQKNIHQYNTSIFPAYQIANYLGFDKIYLVGCDLGFDSTAHKLFRKGVDPAIISDPHNQRNQFAKYYQYVRMSIQSNHKIKSLVNGWYYFCKKTLPFVKFGKKFNFTDDYREEKVYLGEDDRHRRAHNLAKDKLAKRGVTVKNATVGGSLNIFPRCEIRELL
jgi:hypothetical protein